MSDYYPLLQSLALFLLPLLYRSARTFYARARPTGNPIACPRRTRYVLDLLTLSAVACFVLTLPWFAPENIITRTSSRLLQTPTDVLFTRLSALRPLTDADAALRSRLNSRDGRLLFATYGPAPLAECVWCRLDDATTFMLYRLPALVGAHLAHLAVLGAATSGRFGRFGPTWRTPATLTALAIFAVEVWCVCVSSADMDANLGARTPDDVVWTYWRMRNARMLTMALVDTLLGLALWMSATRRWSIGWQDEVVEESIEGIQRRLERAMGQLQAFSYFKQTVVRDPRLRARSGEWWEREDALGKEMMADEEVVQAKLNAGGELSRSEAEKRTMEFMDVMCMVAESQRNHAAE